VTCGPRRGSLLGAGQCPRLLLDLLSDAVDAERRVTLGSFAAFLHDPQADPREIDLPDHFHPLSAAETASPLSAI
jgi:hypothetical protein